MSNYLKITTLIVGLFLLLLFGSYVWPTQFRYYITSDSNGDIQFRENRFTGKIEFLGFSGWEFVSQPVKISLPVTESAKYDYSKNFELLNPKIENDIFVVNIYNKNFRDISDINIRLIEYDPSTNPPKEIKNRIYPLIFGYDIRQYQNSNGHARLGFEANPKYKYEFNVHGYRFGN